MYGDYLSSLSSIVCLTSKSDSTKSVMVIDNYTFNIILHIQSKVCVIMGTINMISEN